MSSRDKYNSVEPAKFSNADMLAAAGALGFGVFCFLGRNYRTFNVAGSVALAAAVCALLLALALVARALKRTDRITGATFPMEVGALVLLTGLSAYFTYTPFSHFFSVSERKAEIKEALKKSVDEAGPEMFRGYDAYVLERLGAYRVTLDDACLKRRDSLSQYAKYGCGTYAAGDSAYVDFEVEVVRKELSPTNYEHMKQRAFQWAEGTKRGVDRWHPFKIGKAVNDIGKKGKEWLAAGEVQGDGSKLPSLVELSQKGNAVQKGNPADLFSYTLSAGGIKETYFTKTGKPAPLSYAIAALLYALLLLPYLAANRSPKARYRA